MQEKSLVVSSRIPEPGRRLASLVQQLLKAGKPQAMKAIHGARAWVNGKPCLRGDWVLEPGDRLEVFLEPEVRRPSTKGKSVSRPLQVVHEDEQLIVVNKPPAVLTVPTHYQEKNTLLAAVERWMRQNGEAGTACCVHRLDRGVSGLLVFAKSVDVAEALRRQFEARKPLRRYLAIVAGLVEPPRGTFRSYLDTDPKTLQRFSTDDAEAGELAVTHYSVLRQWPDAALVEVWLETGRRNQIRVHFAEAGHPVLGDERYGRELGMTAAWPHRRLALHAQSLGFTHPESGQLLEFTCPLPPEMKEFRNRQERGSRRRRDP